MMIHQLGVRCDSLSIENWICPYVLTLTYIMYNFFFCYPINTMCVDLAGSQIEYAMHLLTS